MEDQPHVLQPAFNLRDKVREALLGGAYWDKATKLRKERFGFEYSIGVILAFVNEREDKDGDGGSSSEEENYDDDHNHNNKDITTTTTDNNKVQNAKTTK